MSENFRNFSSLPAEIRTMIWENSLPEPRVYEVLDAPHAKQKTPAGEGLMFANVHPEPPPALAAVCRESRYFVLRHYKRLTLGKTTKFVDLSRDMLLLEPYLLVKRLHRTLHFMSQIPLIRDNINRLALGTSYGVYTGICHPVLSWKVSKNNMGKLLGALSKFARLKTLIFIVHQEFQFEFDFRYPPSYPAQVPPPAQAVGHGPLSLPSMLAPLPPPPSSHYFASATGYVAQAPLPPLGPSPTPSPRPQASLPASLASSPSPPPSLPPPAHAPGSLVPAGAPRPQIVHQAYRFKFDIEANINYHPRRPHLNELLYYPLDREEDNDDWESVAKSLGGGGAGLGPDDEESEWCDPWVCRPPANGRTRDANRHFQPTNDDYRRFRRRFQRSVLLCLSTGQAEGCKYTHKTLPEIKGASLLWRYTRGGECA